VDNPNTPTDECNPPTPCVDNMNTPQDECNPPPVCPPGTDSAGQPIPPGGIDKCDDDVLGDTIGDVDGDTDDDVLGRREPNPPPGAVMPFTGTSVLAYVLVGLQMIGAGALIARSRKRK
jgi:LPXTG-motif cell wall-anchored protein